MFFIITLTPLSLFVFLFDYHHSDAIVVFFHTLRHFSFPLSLDHSSGIIYTCSSFSTGHYHTIREKVRRGRSLSPASQPQECSRRQAASLSMLLEFYTHGMPPTPFISRYSMPLSSPDYHMSPPCHACQNVVTCLPHCLPPLIGKGGETGSRGGESLFPRQACFHVTHTSHGIVTASEHRVAHR